MAHSPTTELKAAGPTAVDVSQKEPFLSVSLLSWTFCYSNRHWPAQPRTAQFCHLVSGLSLSFLAHSLPCVQHILSPVKQGTHWHETNVSNHIMAKKIKKDSSRRGQKVQCYYFTLVIYIDFHVISPAEPPSLPHLFTVNFLRYSLQFSPLSHCTRAAFG